MAVVLSYVTARVSNAAGSTGGIRYRKGCDKYARNGCKQTVLGVRFPQEICSISLLDLTGAALGAFNDSAQMPYKMPQLGKNGI